MPQKELSQYHDITVKKTGNRVNHFHIRWHIKAFLLKPILLGHNLHKTKEMAQICEMRNIGTTRKKKVSFKESFRLHRTHLWHFSIQS